MVEVDFRGYGHDGAPGGQRAEDAVWRVLDRDAVSWIDIEGLGGRRVWLGIRLAVQHVVIGDDRIEVVAAEGVEHHLDERPCGGGDECGTEPGGAYGLEQLAGAGPPRGTFGEQLEHAIFEPLAIL